MHQGDTVEIHNSTPETNKEKYINVYRKYPLCDEKTQSSVKAHLNEGPRVDFVNSIPWRSPCLSVQVVTLHEDSVVAKATHPHVSLSTALQLNAFADVKPEGWASGVSISVDMLCSSTSH